MKVIEFNKKGSITVFLCLMICIFLVFINSVYYSSIVQVTKSYKRTEETLALQSVFAEYQKEILEHYDIFTLDGSYGKKKDITDEICKRLDFYGSNSTKVNIKELQLLTDNGGAAFIDQIINYMEHKYGIQYLVKKQKKYTQSNENNQSKQIEYAGKEVEKKQNELSLETSSSDGTSSSVTNYITEVKKQDGDGIMIPKKYSISPNAVEISTMPSHRNLNKGIGTSITRNISEIQKKTYICEYIYEKFQAAQLKEESLQFSNVLEYQLEYIIEGNNSDEKNLKGVLYKLVALRLAPNYTCLLTSKVKQAEVTTLATTIATAATVPYLAPLFKQSILVAWAYGESLLDVKSLVKGEKVEIVKREKDWKLDSSMILELNKVSDTSSNVTNKKGLSYKEYLRSLLYLIPSDKAVMRALDLIENQVVYKYNNKDFQIDYCVNRIKYECTYKIKNKYTYQFPVEFMYS